MTLLQCSLLKIIICFLMLWNCSNGLQVDVYLPLSSAPGTLIGDLDALSHPDLLPISNAPYFIIPNPDSNKVSINSNMLYLDVQPPSETMYAISVIHSNGTFSLSLHFILNGEDYRPFISTDILKLSIVESTSIGVALNMFTCEDYQRNKTLTHLLIPEYYRAEMKGMFAIHSDGALLVNAVLNALNTPYVPLLVTCQDPRAPYHPSYAAVVINITQTDTTVITCTSPLSFRLCEDRPAGPVSDIRCYHPSYNFSSSLDYTFSDARFNGENGQLILTSHLNYEDTASFSFTITVTDRLDPALTDAIPVTVTVIPVNEFVPILTRTEYHVSETVPTSFTFQLEASDLDLASHGEIEFILVNPPTNLPFSLDVDGTIHVTSLLDYEVASSYSVDVQVTDKLDPIGAECDVGNKSSIIQITIPIDDVNEKPSFPNTPYTFELLDTTPLNSGIGSVFCSDPDDDNFVNGIISYSLITSSTVISISTVNGHGQLTLRTELDFTNASSYAFQVVCIDQGTPTLQDTTQINIPVTPFIEFEKSLYTAEIAENSGIGTFIVKVSLSLSSITSYNFVSTSFSIISDTSNSAIVIDMRTGLVTLGKLLPRGMADNQYQLDIQATAELLSKDGSTKIVSAASVITVNILNATTLLFSEIYSVNVSENARNVELVTILAFNRLTGISTDIIYSLLHPSSVYLLNNITGLLVLNSSLDRETQRQHFIEVGAHDRFNASIQATTVITLTVLDLNDVTPSCISFTERFITGSLFTTPTALTPPLNCIDNDAESPNNLITYSLSGASAQTNITVDPTTGEILGLGSLSVGLYDYTIVVSDRGVSPGPLNTTEIVQIHITVNNYHPQFVNTPSSIELSENHTLTTVIQIFVSDDDTGPPGDITLTYEVISTSEDIFSLDSNTGVFSLLQSLDYERVREYDVLFNATDNGRPRKSNTTHLKIVVLNLNDENPRCDPVPTLRLDFDNHYPDTLLQLICTDPDNLTDLLFYSISAISNASSYFTVSDKGAVSTNSSFQGLASIFPPVYLPIPITVGENNSDLVTELTINVLLGDSGFSFDFVSISPPTIPEDATYSTPVATFVAAHTPTQPSLLISYSIHLISPYGDFSIDANTGELTVAGSLDFEGVKEYNITIRAVDDALYKNLRLYETTISVLDVCDNPPIVNLARSSIQINQSAYASPNKVIQSFPCSDRDSGVNGQISCSIAEATPDIGSPFFTMSGCDLILARDLNTTCVSTFDLVINCTDLCDVISLRTVNSFQFSVSVEFENLNKPMAIAGYYPRSVSISENQIVPQLISTSSLHFADLDCNPYNQTYFSITNSIPGYLIVDKGDIYLNNSIDFDGDILLISESHRITSTVRVFDCPELVPSCEGSGPPNTVTIQFVDQNDNRPVCQKYIASISIPETTLIGSTYATSIICDDLDLSHDSLGNINFEINNTDVRISETFQVLAIIADTNTQSAELNVRLLQSLDHENSSLYVLHVRVFDGGSPPIDSKLRITLTISVRNINEHGPFYSPTSQTLFIREDFDTSFVVLNALASDLDDPPEHKSVYSLIVTPNEKFRIHNTTADISLTSSLDRETVSRYELQVTATEIALPSNRTAKLNITIILTDFNDNPPILTLPAAPLQVPQSVPFAVIHTFPCSDRDEGINSMFNCDVTSLVYEGMKLFSFSVVSHSCTLSIDTNPVPNCTVSLNHFLTINCTDKGSPSIINSFPVSVHVNLENLQTPVVQNTPISFTLSESTPASHLIGDISTYVNDGDCGNFGVLRYTIENQFPNSPTYVSLTSDGSQLTLINQLDFDDPIFGNPPTLTLEILVQDNLGSGSFREVRFNVSILITDSNDNPPTCTDYSIDTSIDEGSLTSVDLATICYDIDSGLNGELSMTFLSDHPDLFVFERSPFNSSHSRVSITPMLALDFEDIESYSVIVSITDLVVPQLTANITVSVYVNNINDNAPFFLSTPTSLSITENAPPKILATISALDLDKGIFGEIVYTLITARYDPRVGFVDISQGNTSQFELGIHTGELNQIAEIDYETNVVFHVGVLASDGGSPSITNKTYFNITIEDVNEFNPHFVTPAPAALLQGAANGTTVAFIEVLDFDREDGFTCYISSDSIPYSMVHNIFILNQTELGFFITLRLPVVCNDPLLYQFHIVCNDTGLPSRSNSTNFNVSIVPENLNVPIANPTQVSMNLSENQAIGLVIFDVSSLLSDPDCAMEGSYRYSIESQVPSAPNFLVINQYNGEVSVNETIDYESILFQFSLPKIEIRIQVEDDLITTGYTPISSLIQLTAFVLDVNDNPAECSHIDDKLSVPEAMSPLNLTTRIICSDRDTFTNMTAQLLNTGLASIFNVEMVNVMDTMNVLVLYILNDLDFESVVNYTLEVLILDPTNPSFNQSISIFIEVYAVNEFDPVIDPLVTTFLNENNMIGHSLANITVQNSDKNESLIFYITQDFPYVATIDSVTGAITLNTSLDYETPEYAGTHTITVYVQDTGIPPRTSMPVILYFVVRDSNDNPVEITFIGNNSYFEILQSQRSGIVANLSCTDVDSSFNKKFSCLISNSTNPINNAQTVFSVKHGDEGPFCQICAREAPPCVDELRYNLTLICDGLFNSLGATTFDFVVHLIPQNLNAPIVVGVFPLLVHISETLTKNYPIVINITTSIASQVSDPDCGLFGQIVFVIVSEEANNIEYISLDNKTGVVTIISEVDKEVFKAQTGSGRINIPLNILDNNGEPGFRKYPQTGLISVDILDEDDEPPYCTPTNLSVSFEEGNTNFFINIPNAGFQCTDPDDCIFTKLTAASNNSNFTIIADIPSCTNVSDVRTGTFTLVAINLSNLENVRLTHWDILITVSDGKMGAMHSTFVYFHVELIDVNEAGIAFSQSSYSLVLNVTSPIGPLDLSVTATDEDFTSEIRYSTTDQFFSVDQINGRIILLQPLNSTNQTTFQVPITATDLASFDTLSVFFNAIVNHPPMFIKSMVLQYCTNSTDAFLTLPYRDNNLNVMGQDVIVVFFSPHSNPLLQISNSTTKIDISASDPDMFDQMIPSEYTINVRDSAGFIDSFTFNLTKCSSMRRREVSPSRAKRAVIKTLHFSQLVIEVYLPLLYPLGDVLTPQFCVQESPGLINYSLLTANHSDWPFIMDSVSGNITVDEALGRLVYHLVLSCNNSLHEDIASYIVIVLEEDQYTPRFLKGSYTFSIPENTANNVIIGLVTAQTDRMHRISYTATGVNFAINPMNGNISLVSNLDFETMSSHTFTVTATNEDIMSIRPTSTVPVIISVTDANDNGPVFISNAYFANINIPNTAPLPVGIVIAQAQCMDADLDATNQIVYSLAVPDDVFDIKPSNGYIYISSNPQLLNLAYRDQFIVLCTDETHLPTPASDMATVHITTSPHFPPTCPRVSNFGLDWPETALNSTTTVICPETPQVALRFCSLEANWDFPDLSNCMTYPDIAILPTPLLIPENCNDFFTQYLSNLALINSNIRDTSDGKLHLAGDIKLAMEYFIAARELITCPSISKAALDSLARLIIEGINEFTRSHFSDAWLTLTEQLQRTFSMQLLYILNQLSHRLLSPNAKDMSSIATVSYAHIATELHPDHTNSVSSPYNLQAVPTTMITFSSCYLQAVAGDLGFSYLNDTTRVSAYLPSSQVEGVIRLSVSTSLLGVYTSNYSDNGQNCKFEITFLTREGSEMHMCALWEFSTGYLGSWNTETCVISSQMGNRINCSCEGQGIVTVIGTMPLPVYPDCFPLPDLVVFILFVLSSAVIILCIAISIVGNISNYRKDFKNPSLYFKLHALIFLCLAEIANFVGVFLIPYDSVCRIMAIIVHVLFVFVFCWILMFSAFHLAHFLLPRKEKNINRFSICIFFAGYAIPSSLMAISLIDLNQYGVVAPPETSKCHFLYCWISSLYDTFPTLQLVCGALPLMLTQFTMSIPLLLHFLVPEPVLNLNNPKRPIFNTKLAPSYFYSETIPGFIQIYLVGLHYAFLSTAYDGLLFAILSLVFSLLTSAFLLFYHTGLISSFTRKSSQPYTMKPKRKQTEFVNVEDYETRLVTRQHERVNWAFLNVQEERFYEEGRQLGAHFNIAKPSPTESLASLNLDF